jgi:hypothetical protein
MLYLHLLNPDLSSDETQESLSEKEEQVGERCFEELDKRDLAIKG